MPSVIPSTLTNVSSFSVIPPTPEISRASNLPSASGIGSYYFEPPITTGEKPFVRPNLNFMSTPVTTNYVSNAIVTEYSNNNTMRVLNNMYSNEVVPTTSNVFIQNLPHFSENNLLYNNGFSVANNVQIPLIDSTVSSPLVNNNNHNSNIVVSNGITTSVPFTNTTNMVFSNQLNNRQFQTGLPLPNSENVPLSNFDFSNISATSNCNTQGNFFRPNGPNHFFFRYTLF